MAEQIIEDEIGGASLGMERPGLPTKKVIEAHERRIEFLNRQILEGPNRKPPIPAEQITIHQGELAQHTEALKVLQAANVVYLPVETQPEAAA